jgi:hypothetical protein
MKRVIVGVVAVLGALAGTAAPGLAEQPPPRDVGSYAHDDQACGRQQQLPEHRSPSCRPAGTGIESNHSETLVRDAG